MTLYHVSWRIDIDADNPEDAAQKALDIQRDPTSSATVFAVVREGTRLSCKVDLGYNERLRQ